MTKKELALTTELAPQIEDASAKLKTQFGTKFTELLREMSDKFSLKLQ